MTEQVFGIVLALCIGLPIGSILAAIIIRYIFVPIFEKLGIMEKKKDV